MKLIIIGAGPGGYETAIEAVRQGIETVLITDGPLGGVCLSEGCIPTKTLCHYAELVEQVHKASLHEITSEMGFDFSKIMARKEEVVAQLQGGITQMLKHKLLTIVYGTARFKDAHTVEVLPDGEVFEADYIIIASGSVSVSLPVEGKDLTGVIMSREALSLIEVPSRLAVIGGGVIGLELASIFRSFGSEVTVLEYAPRILPRFDAELSKRLKLALGARGIRIETSAEVKRISQSQDALGVIFETKNGELCVEADKVLMAVGRRPNVESLNLQDIGVEFSRKGIAVDSNMQTSVSGVYAIGDVTGGMMLAHVATFQGKKVLAHILGQQDIIDLDKVPAAVFTIPEAACIGLSEEDAKERGIAVKCYKSRFAANGKAVSMDETEGFCKIVCDASSGLILGAHILGAHSSDLIHEIAALMRTGGDISALRSMIHAHPTLSEILLVAV